VYSLDFLDFYFLAFGQGINNDKQEMLLTVRQEPVLNGFDVLLQIYFVQDSLHKANALAFSLTF
jgi:hypothetical protein